MDAAQLLFSLIRVAVCGEQPTEKLKNDCMTADLDAVYKLARWHDLAHLAAQGINKLQLPDSPALKKFKTAAMEAFVRYTQQEYACQQVCGLLEQGQIPFIPLKGTVLRQVYPEPWMRTSCDLDILIGEQHLEPAAALLEKSGWTFRRKTSHDLDYVSPEKVNLELHFDTIEDYVSQNAKKIMENIWDLAQPVAGKQYHMAIPDSLFYYYHMAHMAKHLVFGGCGIRSFLDIWIMNHRMEFDPAARQTLLVEGKLAAFASGVQKLAEIWFSGAPMDEMSRKLQEFVLFGGVYGNMQNRLRMQQVKKGGKFQLALSRIFLPYREMVYRYKVLEKHKWLLPLCHIARWCRLILCGGVKRSVRELKRIGQMRSEKKDGIGSLYDYLEL